MSLAETAEAVRTGSLSALSLTEDALARCAALEPLNALHSIDAEGARAAAKAVDADPKGRLAGVPVVLKDNLLQTGRPCTCSSRMLASYRGSYDATVVERLVAEGAVVVGRANMDEFAMGSSSESCAWGPVRNPWDLTRVPGGSSGGSAAAVAAGAVPAALGSDTGGSVRQPAAFTGLVALKPTWGRISRRGLVAFASSTDQVGPLTRTVADCALVAEVIAGPDPADATTLPGPVPDWSSAVRDGLQGRVLGVPALPDDLDDEVARVTRHALGLLRDAGAELREVRLPSLELAVACYYVLAPAEASANLARFDGIRYGTRIPGEDPEQVYENTRSRGFGREVQRRILVGTYVLSAGYVDAYYNQAQRVRARIRAELDRVLQDVDALVTPTTPTPAWALGAVTDPVSMYLADVFTIPASLAGIPALSVPCGAVGGLPVGLHVQAAARDEATCFAVGGALERAIGPLDTPPFQT